MQQNFEDKLKVIKANRDEAVQALNAKHAEEVALLKTQAEASKEQLRSEQAQARIEFDNQITKAMKRINDL